jgi:hypothetical protein
MRLLPAAAAHVCAFFACASAFGGVSDVGSQVVARPNDEGAGGVIHLYLGGTQPLAGPGSINGWSFFDADASTAGQRVTPLLFEVTGASQWTVVAIGTTRSSTALGVQTYDFGTIAGITALQSGKRYTVGFTHREYSGNDTPANATAGVIGFTGYGVYTDRWAYAYGTAVLGTVLGTGGIALDSIGFGGRIYSASFGIDATPSIPVAYCTPGTSSSGCIPWIGSSGTPSVSASSGFTIQVTSVEGERQGILFYGVGGRVIAPWGSGGTSYLCVGYPIQRTTVSSSGGTSGACNGTFAVDWLAFLAANPGALGAPFSAGQIVDAQAWYRDPPAVKTTNLSDALEFATGP